jgi:hypothetical protein
MVRYILFRWGNLPRVYVHKFLRSDDERAPHNHPWWFVSLVLKGRYLEHLADRSNVVVRKPLSVAYRALSVFHRVELIDDQPCWTLVITGPDVRSWGFLCQAIELVQIGPHEWFEKERNRLVPWREFDGCGE